MEAAPIASEPSFVEASAPAASSHKLSEPLAGEQYASGTKVCVGHKVRVRFADGQARTLTVQIVPEGEADGRTRIGLKSPLAKAILGLRAEDETEVVIDGRKRELIIEDISTDTLAV
jgi:transcription elongation GreA/GreB family factor